MADTLIEEKVERALQAVIRDAATGIADEKVFLGHDVEIKAVNYVVCMVLSASEDLSVPGNWTVRARVGTFGDCDAQDDDDTPLADFNTQAGNVSDALMQDNLGALLGAAVDGLLIYDPIPARRKIPDMEGRKWVKWLELDLYGCCLDA